MNLGKTRPINIYLAPHFCVHIRSYPVPSVSEIARAAKAARGARVVERKDWGERSRNYARHGMLSVAIYMYDYLINYTRVKSSGFLEYMKR